MHIYMHMYIYAFTHIYILLYVRTYYTYTYTHIHISYDCRRAVGKAAIWAGGLEGLADESLAMCRRDAMD